MKEASSSENSVATEVSHDILEVWVIWCRWWAYVSQMNREFLDEVKACELRKDDGSKQQTACVTNPMLSCKYSIDDIASFFFL
jgi:hypothetical protein